MGRPLHQQIGFDLARQVTHVPLSKLSDNTCRRQVKPPVDVLSADVRTTSYVETSSHACLRQVMHDGSGGGGMFSLLLLDRRWCDSSGRQAVWDVFVFCCLLQRYPAIVVSIDG